MGVDSHGMAAAERGGKPEGARPAGAAYFPVEKAGPTRSYAFVLVPGFTLLAFASAVEPLRIANQLSQQRPLYRWRLFSKTGRRWPVPRASPWALTRPWPRRFPTGTPGFSSVRGNPAMAAASPAVVAAVTRHHRFGGTVGGICTGAVALAKAGLVQGRRFTLHWRTSPASSRPFPN